VNRYRGLIFERERRYSPAEAIAGKAEHGGSIAAGNEMPVARAIPNIDHRFGNGKARVIGVELMDAQGRPAREVMGGDTVLLRISVEFLEDVACPILGYTLRDRLGVEISACNTTYAGSVLPDASKGQIFTSDFTIRMPRLASGSYSISPAVAEGELFAHDMCDWIDNALVFALQGDQLVYGMLKMDIDVCSYYQETGKRHAAGLPPA
jgi:hypothetical protein